MIYCNKDGWLGTGKVTYKQELNRIQSKSTQYKIINTG